MDGTPVLDDFYPRPPRGGRPGRVQGEGRAHRISIHALREEGDGSTFPTTTQPEKFLSTPSARRATVHPDPQDHLQQISIHALREEGDASNGSVVQRWVQFLSTPSARRATYRSGSGMVRTKFLSTPSARRATTTRQPPSIRSAYFYPRPPRGGRPSHHCRFAATLPISIHALREEGDLISLSIVMAAEIFLSTPSARRATQHRRTGQHGDFHFYPRPPRGGRRPSGCSL